MSSGKKLALLALWVLFAISVVRLLSGPPKPKGVIELRIDRGDELVSSGFEIREPVPIVIQAVGRIGSRSDGPDLDVYGWVLSESTNKAIWTMDLATVDRFDQALAIVESDTMTLQSGRYSVHLTSYPAGVWNYRRTAARDRDDWKVTVWSADPRNELVERSASSVQESADAFWSAAPLENQERHDFFFEVHQTADLGIYAIGQIDAEDASPLMDYSWIEEAETGRPIWHLSVDNTQWAGGARTNRMFKGSIKLQPGIYLTVARTNGRHAFDEWDDYPPTDPFGWGITLTTAQDGTITRFDPWMDAERDPIISITRVMDDESHHRRFDVSERTSVVIWAMGEMTSEEGVWDTASLSQIVDGQTTEIWSMDYLSSMHGGGGDKNRVAIEFLQLEPGEYQLNYTSDGSHSYESWNMEAPNHPERWGATLFPISDNAVDVITVLP